MENLIGHLISLLAGTVAIIGGTWNSNANGIKKLTLTGLATFILLVCGLGFSAYKQVLSDAKQDELNGKIIRSEKEIISANSKLSAYEKILGKLEMRTQTMLQVVFQRIIDFDPLEVVDVEKKYNASNVIYGGSIIEPYYHNCDLEFIYDRGKFPLKHDKKFVVQGFAGQEMKWSIKNNSNLSCNGMKLLIYSTPIGRSKQWSDDSSIHD
jgi:hypothetical protein